MNELIACIIIIIYAHVRALCPVRVHLARIDTYGEGDNSSTSLAR